MIIYRKHRLTHFIIWMIIIIYTNNISYANNDKYTNKNYLHNTTQNYNNNNINEHKKNINNQETEKIKNIKKKILNQYNQWKGTPYLLGGNTKKGIDCSAFVQITFKEQFKLKLPRSTIDQKKIGCKIHKQELRPGDLIFFYSPNNGRHIGIYIENNQFIHASKSKGVTISNLNSPYWKNHYAESRRVIFFT